MPILVEVLDQLIRLLQQSLAIWCIRLRLKTGVVADMIELTRQYGRYGYRRIAALLRDAGWQVNDKRAERLWRREWLKVPTKQPKKARLWLNDGSCVRLRDEVLNGEVFCSLSEAQIIIEEWRKHYNTKRPHGALRYRPPAPETIVPMASRPIMH